MPATKDTRFPALVVGVTAMLASVMGASTVLYVQGDQEIQGEIRYTNTASGATVRIGSGSTNIHDGRSPLVVNCTATGGGLPIGGSTAYDTCIMTNPFASGAVVSMVSFEIGGSPVDAHCYDIGYVSAVKTGSAVHLANNFCGGTGANLLTASGGRVWGSDEFLKVGMGGAGEPTAQWTGRLRVWAWAKFGN